MTKQPKYATAAEHLKKLEIKRRKFLAELQAYEASGHRYIDRAAPLDQDMVADCRLFANRYDMLETLPKNGVVGEVGTDRGDFAARIIEVAKPSKLEIFEIDVSRINPDNLSSHIDFGLCEVHEGDSAKLIAAMPDSYFDWLYIDGNHSYAGAKKDAVAAMPKIKPGGFLVFNDYAVWSVTSMRRCGVAQVVNELIRDHKWPMTAFAFQGSMYCDAAVQKPA